jgi:hypothetical protein
MFISNVMDKLKLTREPRAEFSILEVAACHPMSLLHSKAIRSNLELKTQPKQLLGSLLFDIALPGNVHKQ